MATAPRPGAVRAAGARRVGVRIRVGEREHTLHVADLGPSDDIASRRETGLPVTPFFGENQFGIDSLLIMYWMARRKNGEPNLRFEEILSAYPTYESVTEAGFAIEALEEDGEDPDPLDSAGS